MYSFTSIKQDDMWIIIAVRWDNIEALYDYEDFSRDLNVKTKVLKTTLVKKWKGAIADDDNIEFETKEDAESAIAGYLDGLLTAAVLAGE